MKAASEVGFVPSRTLKLLTSGYDSRLADHQSPAPVCWEKSSIRLFHAMDQMPDKLNCS